MLLFLPFNLCQEGFHFWVLKNNLLSNFPAKTAFVSPTATLFTPKFLSECKFVLETVCACVVYHECLFTFLSVCVCVVIGCYCVFVFFNQVLESGSDGHSEKGGKDLVMR